MKNILNKLWPSFRIKKKIKSFLGFYLKENSRVVEIHTFTASRGIDCWNVYVLILSPHASGGWTNGHVVLFDDDEIYPNMITQWDRVSNDYDLVKQAEHFIKDK